MPRYERNKGIATTSSFLLLVAMHLLLVAMHLLLVAMHLLLVEMHFQPKSRLLQTWTFTWERSVTSESAS